MQVAHTCVYLLREVTPAKFNGTYLTLHATLIFLLTCADKVYFNICFNMSCIGLCVEVSACINSKVTQKF